MTDIIRCRDCKHWTWNNHGEDEIKAWSDGECAKIGYEIEIEVNAGWDGGTVGAITTEQNWYCAGAEKKS